MTHTRSPQVITVALNPALDQTIEVASLHTGAVNRALRVQVDVGGKAINVASCLADFGIATAVVGQLGRDNAALFNELFQRKQIANHCCVVDGLTRVNTKLVDVARGETTDLNMPGPELTPQAAAALLAHIQERLEPLAKVARWVVLSGSLPPGMPTDAYATLTRQAQQAGAAVLLDTSGVALQAALPAAPRWLKPNRHELTELVNRPLDTLPAVLAAGRELLAGRLAPQQVVVSMGEQGALFLTGDEALLAQPLAVPVTSTVGAGDAMVAGLVAGQLHGATLTGIAQLATAFAAAKLTRLGPHLPAPEAVRALARQVTVTPIA